MESSNLQINPTRRSAFKRTAARILKVGPPLLWASFIFYLSSIPSLRSPFGIWDLYLRKAAHVFVYFVLTLLIAPNFRPGRRQRVYSFLIAGVYAVGDEYHQSFVPGRVMCFYDMVLNWIGCASAYFLLIFLNRNSRLKIFSGR